MVKIFISYSHRDRLFLDDVINVLSRAFLNDHIWFDDKIPGGYEWEDSIFTEISECDLFISLLSDDAINSSNCRSELREAIRLRKHILPVVIKIQTDISNAPSDLSDHLEKIQRVDLSRGVKEHESLATFLGAVSGLREAARAKQIGTLESELDGREKGTSRDWKKHRTGNIYWLASNLTLAITIAQVSDPNDVKDYVRKTLWHVYELGLDETIKRRFEGLWEKTCSFTQTDWDDSEKREKIAIELNELLITVASDMQRHTDFRPHPTDDWKKC